jgi:hypothetical protein
LQAKALIVVQVADAFGHGVITPTTSAVAMLALPVDGAFAGLIDDGLDTQDQAEFVVHFQPVLFHVVFDAAARLPFGFVIGQDFTVELAVQFATEKAEDVLGREMDDGVFQEFRE